MPRPDFQPTLVGPTITVRPIAAGDWTELFAAGSDPEIWRVHPVRATGRLIGSSRYYGHEPELSEIEIGWTFLARSHWGGRANREVKRLMLDHAFTFVDTVVFWVGDQNWRSQGAMAKIGGVKRRGLFVRELSGDRPYFIFEITKSRYWEGGRTLVE